MLTPLTKEAERCSDVTAQAFSLVLDPGENHTMLIFLHVRLYITIPRGNFEFITYEFRNRSIWGRLLACPMLSS